jgi:glucose dehydrogenase
MTFPHGSRGLLALGALLMLACSILLAIGGNAAVLVTAGVCVVLTMLVFRRFWLVIALFVVLVLCTFVTWAILDGGANEATAIPTALGAVVAGTWMTIIALAGCRRRRRSTSAETSPAEDAVLQLGHERVDVEG